jgi:hypothetical protein
MSILRLESSSGTKVLQYMIRAWERDSQVPLSSTEW